MQITTGKYHTLLISNSSVYSCGSGLCGVLGQGPETTQCVAFTRIDFPPLARVAHVSASFNHAAFVLQSGEVSGCLNLIKLAIWLMSKSLVCNKLYPSIALMLTNATALRASYIIYVY